MGEGNGTGRNDVQTDDLVLVVEQHHAELFTVGLAVGLDQLADDGLGLLGSWTACRLRREGLGLERA